MTDIARLGFRADTQELKDAKQSLDALVPSAKRAEAAVDGVANSFTKEETAAEKAARGTQAAKTAMEQAAQGAGRTETAATTAAGGWDRLTGAVGRLISRLTGVGPAATSATSSLNRMGRAANDNINAMQATPGNIAAQFQDIGVTAAAGMSPMLIALQQGTQLSAAMSGGLKNLLLGLGQVFNATTLLTIGLVGLIAAFIQWVDWTALAQDALNGLADIMVPIAPYAVGIAAALALIYSPAIIAGIWSLVSGFVGLLASMVATLGIPALIVLGLAAVIAAANVWRDELTQILGFDIVAAAKSGVNDIVGGFVGAYNTIIEVWRQLPSALGDAAYQAANKIRAGLNGLFTLKDGDGNVRWQPFDGQMANPYAGSLASVGAAAQRNITAARGVDYVGMGVSTVQGFAGDAAAWLRGIASGMGASEGDDKDKAGRERRGRKEAIDRTVKDFIQGLNDQRDALLDVNAQVGIYGEDLMRLKHEQELFNAAQGKGIKITDELTAELKNRAAEMASLEMSTVRDQFNEDRRRQHADRMWQLERERGELGLTTEALAAYRFETEALAAARAKNIPLNEVEIAQIKSMAVEYSAMMEMLARQKKALEDQRQTVRGFFKDWYDGLMSGRGLFSSFVDAVINGLSRIADKMMDKAIDKFLDIMFAGNNGTSAGAGGFIDSILGAVFGGGKVPMAGGAKNFAQGTVVDRPSLFTMAGGGIGRMGEAGEEAIMPLTRGPDGSLGVQSHGNKGGTTIYAPVTVNNDNRVTGAVSSEDIVAMQRAQAEQTKRELEREIPEILNRYQTDGAVAA
jgi:hypothetical protein